MFTDRIKLKLKAGKGGNGAVAWRREKYIPKGGPSGGNGGKGGSIIIKTDPSIRSLDHFRNRRQISAENGQQGSANLRQGRQGEDLILKIPPGTLLRDATTGTLLYDFTKKDEELTLCEGGKGGLGNHFFKNSRNRAPTKSTPGKLGQLKEIELELKLIADVGFVGLPSAGKSTLLSTLANIEVKTGAYPFTTLSPNLSMIEFDDYSRVYFADIPGLIANAHKGKGLGHEFLRHVERTNTLVFILDLSFERDPKEDLATLRNELGSYSPKLLEKPYIIALNKIDLLDATLNPEELFPNETIFCISALNGEGLPPLLEEIKTVAQRDGKRFY
ncbi:MAG: GTPase ObgE [Candidatus Algichlamydia australiensis]|nr:GTPase ObgE [Chlamydiales bacterium]